MHKTFYWHDYETWGIYPALDRPVQFAGVRTDWDLNIIGEPLLIYSQPPLERLPHPRACLITGITPQYALEHGLPENKFCEKIYQQFNQQNTCSVGYNNLRFDDEVTRHLFYRNFYPVYDREWKQGNSRWDLIDVLRLCYALRSDGIHWPLHEEGVPSFKLEDLSKANGLMHENAHDALSDVYATIALARLLKETKPKLFEYALSLREKRNVLQKIDLAQRKPLLYISSFFSAKQGCASLVMPLAVHPNDKNVIIAFDLRQAPDALLKENAQQLSQALFKEPGHLPLQVPLISIRINRCPMLVSAKLLDDKVAQHIALDTQQCWQNYQTLLKFDRNLLDMKLKAVYGLVSSKPCPALVEEQLYTGPFFSAGDSMYLDDVRTADSRAWEKGLKSFQDQRLNALQSYYQAQYFPHTLDAQSKKDWLSYCLNNVLKPHSPKELSIDAYLQEVDAIGTEYDDIKQALRGWLTQREELLVQRYQ